MGRKMRRDDVLAWPKANTVLALALQTSKRSGILVFLRLYLGFLSLVLLFHRVLLPAFVMILFALIAHFNTSVF